MTAEWTRRVVVTPVGPSGMVWVSGSDCHDNERPLLRTARRIGGRVSRTWGRFRGK